MTFQVVSDISDVFELISHRCHPDTVNTVNFVDFVDTHTKLLQRSHCEQGFNWSVRVSV